MTERCTTSRLASPTYQTLGAMDRENYVFLSGAVAQPSYPYYLNPYDQCFCRDTRLVIEEKMKTGVDIPGKCYPTQMCSNCDINYSGMCPQQNKIDSGIYYDNDLPYYTVVYPYARPIYYPYPYPYYPRRPSKYRPWHPYRPRPYHDGGSRPPRPWSGPSGGMGRGGGGGRRPGGRGGGRR